MILTAAYILKYKPKSSPWTKVQMNALGLKYPLTSGWVDKLDGTEISDEDAKVFENGQDTVTKKTNKRRRVKLARAKRKAARC